MTSAVEVAERLDSVRRRIAAAGGTGVDVLAVTKGFGPDAIEAAVACGLDDVGENYAQEAIEKVRVLRAAGLVFRLHFIGRLQSNKVRHLAGVVDIWQIIDRASLVDELARCAPGAAVFVQVNATGEADKGGCALADVDRLVDQARSRGLDVRGLMTVGPTEPDATLTRTAFRSTRAAVDRLGLGECSMGMTDDLEIAVGEGSTLVRVGTALFGSRRFGAENSRLA